MHYIGERSEARRLGNSSAYDDIKSRFVEEDEQEEQEAVSENNDNRAMKLKSHQSSQKPLTTNKRPDSVGYGVLIDELENLINL